MNTRTTEFRVGLFVMIALIVGGSITFIIGNQRNVFATKTSFLAEFEGVDGLRPGSPVRIAGLDVGTVTKVEFTDAGRVRVHLSIIDSSAPLVRRGVPRRLESGEVVLDRETGQPVLDGVSLATVGAKGMLGDKLVEISVGQGDPLQEGDVIPSRPAVSIGMLMERGAAMVDQAEHIVRNVDTLLGEMAEEDFTNDVKETTHNVALLTRMAASEEGTIHRFLMDPQFGERLDSTMRNVQAMSNEMALTARSVRAITNEVQNGDGSAHQLIYGPDGARLANNLADVSGEVATLLREVRTGDGLAHDIIYENEAEELMQNVTAMSADMRVIMADVRQGRGTIGGLLVDPSIYEDVKRLVGNLERNDILRALVRYSIRNDEPTETPEARPVE